jgi:hypothetical protein
MIMMEVNQELENKLWSITRPNPINQEDFKQIIDYLFKSLSAFLQQPLEVIGEDFVDEDSFCRSFRGSISPENVFKITYVGVIGLELIGDNFKPHISANLYLFANHFRLTAGQTDRSYIYLEYILSKYNVGEWKSEGWEIDEFDEYEDIDEDGFL